MAANNSNNTNNGNLNNNNLSADEIALYDRQIRLWGREAQEKIRTANILLITLRGLGNEIAKNLVLSGIGSLTLLDNAQIQPKDLSAQFLISEENMQQNRALAAAARLREMNTRVPVHVDPSDVESKTPEFFAAFDLVIATDLDFSALFNVNSGCRLARKPFYAAGVHGLYGFVFADLIAHDFVIEREKSNVASPVNETPTRTILGIATKQENDKIIELVTKREIYSELILANSSPLPEEFTQPRRRKQVTPLLACLRALWEFQRAHAGASPSISSEDVASFTQIATDKQMELKLEREALTAEFIRSFLQNIGSELNPSAAFLGGYLAQNAINVLSSKEQPLQNFLFFDGERDYVPTYPLHPIFPDNVNGS